MNLKFVDDFDGYHSISSAFIIPTFNGLNIVTGINGSGKTHFLEAIQKGLIEVDIEGSTIVREEIALFNYRNFEAKNETELAQSFIQSRKLELFAEINNPLHQVLSSYGNILPVLTNFFNVENNIFVIGALLKLIEVNEVEQVKPMLSNTQQKQELDSLISNLKNNAVIDSFTAQLQPILSSGASVTNRYFADAKDLATISPEDFNRRIMDHISPIFQEGLTAVYSVYWKKFNNFISGLTPDQNSTLTGDQQQELFAQEHKELPWKFLNKMFDTFSENGFNFPCETRAPQDISGSIKAKLFNKLTGEEVEFSSLSSGENALMALSLFLYQSSIDKEFPKLILLDEVDATLHPSLSANFLEALRTHFTDKGVHIIMATHDPSTVANMFDTEKIFLKTKVGIDETTKEDAIEKLSDGFFTLKKTIDIFEKITDYKVAIITEGNNVEHIKKAIKVINPKLLKNVGILTGVENRTGATQLKTLFELFVLAKIEKNIIFVWDCDCSENPKIKNLIASGNVTPFIFTKNAFNSLVSRGIENLYNEVVLEPYTKEQDGNKFLHKDDKKRFLDECVMKITEDTHFKNFEPLIELVNEKIK